jgi:hypothetical protein
MKASLTLASSAQKDAGTEALRVLARVLAPLVAEQLAAQHEGAELVDLLRTVPGPPRVIMRAARSGEIPGACKVGRRWLAPRASVGGWLQKHGPRLVAPHEVVDDLEPLRRSLATDGRHARPIRKTQSNEKLPRTRESRQGGSGA